MPKKQSVLRILVVEDSIGDARLITELLKEAELGDYEAVYITDVQSLPELVKTKFNIILLDLHLTDMPPVDTYKLFHQAFPRVPIVVLTGLADDDLAARIVRLGAQDYLIKGTFGSSTLKRAIRYSIERKKSQLQLAKAQIKTKRLQSNTTILQTETKRLAEVNKAKDVFLSIASHQLRTPATAVKQYLGMMLQYYSEELTDEQRQFLERAYQSNERQLRIVDDLLKVARLDAGHVTLRKTWVPINNFVEKIISDQAESFAIREQTVKFRPVEPDRSVFIDEANLQMVFDNILDNASKYSPRGAKVEVRVSTVNDALTVSFKDNGIGISKSDIAKLFKKFSRTDRSIAYSPNGSGLGLYWAQEIVKLHDGTISIESAVGKGSTFTIWLPHQIETEKSLVPLPLSLAQKLS